jgi:outer membrane protein assembly factor BamB
LVWDFNSNGTGAGIFVNNKFCFIGNNNGYVYALDPDTAQVKHQMKFDAGVKCIVGDRGFLYVGLSNGAVYDCTTGTPRLAYQLDPTSSIEWMDIHDGLIAMDQAGTAVVLNIEGEVVWENKGVGRNRFARTDGARMYHCRQDQVTAYRFADGKELWSVPGGGYVTFGAQDEKYLYTAPLETRALDKETGKLVKQYQNCIPWACTVSDKHVYASDCGSRIVCYDKETTQQIWDVQTGSGKGVSMQYHEAHDRLYVVTEGGHMLCYDVSGNTVEKKIETSSDSQTSDTVTAVPETELKTTDDSSWGVLLVCVKDEKGKLRVRVDPSVPGYDHSLNVQFPRNMRQEGAKFVCTELVEAASGGYYRAKGDIERYQPSTD